MPSRSLELNKQTRIGESPKGEAEVFYGVLADIVVGIHFAFVLFVILGGLFVLRWKRWAWIHIPCVFWGALNEFWGCMCPLTPLENWLRQSGGEAGYSTSFVEHYILPILYPTELTRGLQVVLGLVVIAINAGVYGWLWFRARKRRI